MSKIGHSFYLDEDLLRMIKVRASVAHRSINQEVNYLLRKALDDSAHYDQEALRILRTSMERAALKATD